MTIRQSDAQNLFSGSKLKQKSGFDFCELAHISIKFRLGITALFFSSPRRSFAKRKKFATRDFISGICFVSSESERLGLLVWWVSLQQTYAPSLPTYFRNNISVENFPTCQQYRQYLSLGDSEGETETLRTLLFNLGPETYLGAV